MNDDDVYDCKCSECANPLILFVHELTVVTAIGNTRQIHFECLLCGHQNIHWAGTGTVQWLLSRGANHIVVDQSMELLDVARDLGPWSFMDVAECSRLFGGGWLPAATTEDIWGELEGAQ